MVASDEYQNKETRQKEERDKERDVEAALNAGVKTTYLFSKTAETSKGTIVEKLADIKF